MYKYSIREEGSDFAFQGVVFNEIKQLKLVMFAVDSDALYFDNYAEATLIAGSLRMIGARVYVKRHHLSEVVIDA